ncbi:hypothetical protein NQ317_005026, partial [Molorchus minor]
PYYFQLVPSYFWDASFFMKMGINLMMRSLDSSPFITTSIHNYLWNITDPLLDISEKLAPSLVPTKNVAILNRVYADFVDNVTVYIGPKFGHHKFFLIDKYDGSENLPHLGDKCVAKVVDTSEGISYPQYLTKNDTLRYWRKGICKTADLHYTNDIEKYGVNAYKFELASSMYDRTTPSYDDCYRGCQDCPMDCPMYRNAILLSKLYHFIPKYVSGMSFAVSFPHFLYGDDVLKNYVDGLKPDHEKHQSYVIVEPNTGIPLHGVARSQVNLLMRDMSGYNEKIRKFSNLAIPLIWMEYNQVGIPSYIQSLIYFVVILVPILQYIFTVFALLVGSFIVFHFARKKKRSKNNLVMNKTLTFESEVFLKPS